MCVIVVDVIVRCAMGLGSMSSDHAVGYTPHSPLFLMHQCRRHQPGSH